MNKAEDVSIVVRHDKSSVPLRPPTIPETIADLRAWEKHLNFRDDVLAQTVHWWDARGNRRLIALMSDEYILNVLCWLFQHLGAEASHTPLVQQLRERVLTVPARLTLRERITGWYGR